MDALVNWYHKEKRLRWKAKSKVWTVWQSRPLTHKEQKSWRFFLEGNWKSNRDRLNLPVMSSIYKDWSLDEWNDRTFPLSYCTPKPTVWLRWYSYNFGRGEVIKLLFFSTGKISVTVLVLGMGGDDGMISSPDWSNETSLLWIEHRKVRILFGSGGRGTTGEWFSTTVGSPMLTFLASSMTMSSRYHARDR